MAWFIDRQMDVNPLLAKERERGTIRVEELAEILSGGKELLNERRNTYKIIIKDMESLMQVSMRSLEKPDVYDEGVRRHVIMTKILQEHPELNKTTHHFNVMRTVFQYCFSPFFLHFTMFRDSVESQSTQEQLTTWHDDIDSQKIIGTFAQTEMGHGTNLSCLETTATYDPSTEEFVLNTPTITSTKFWPGGLGKSSNTASLIAQLVVGSKNHGLHTFFVPLRDLRSHRILPGVELGDIGPKMGWNSIDNGYLRLNNVRIPRTNMLMKNSEVTREGTYKKHTKNDKSVYLGLIHARSMSGRFFSGRMVLTVLTVAIRHNVVTMGSLTGDEEIQLIRMKSHLHTLTTSMATGFAFWFAGNRLLQEYSTHYPKIMAGDFSMLPELHAASSGMKALSTDTILRVIERVRQCCGQAGGLVASGFSKYLEITSPGVTIDGENTVLYLQLIRYLAKKFQSSSPEKVQFDVRWSSDDVTKNYHDLESLVKAQKFRNHMELQKVLARMSVMVKEEAIEVTVAWNSGSIQLVEVAKAHAWTYVIESFKEKVNSISDVIIKGVMADLLRLFVYSVMLEARVDFIRCQVLKASDIETIEQIIERLVHALSPNLVSLIDAFDITDYEIDSAVGGFEGRVMEGLLEEVGWVEGGGGEGGFGGRCGENPDEIEMVKRSLRELRESLASPVMSKL